MKLTQWLSISIFVSICGAIVALSLIGKWDGGEYRNLKSTTSTAKQNEESFFKDAQYYLLKQNKKSLNMNASELSLDNTSGRTVFLEPVGTAFTGSGEPINYKGNSGVLKEGKSELTLEGGVTMTLRDSR